MAHSFAFEQVARESPGTLRSLTPAQLRHVAQVFEPACPAIWTSAVALAEAQSLQPALCYMPKGPVHLITNGIGPWGERFLGRTPAEWSATELATAGGPVSLATVARAIEEIFEGHYAARFVSFEDRCHYVGMDYLLAQRPAKDVAASTGTPRFNVGPRKRVEEATGNFPPPA